MLSIFAGSSAKKRGFSLTHGAYAAVKPYGFCVSDFQIRHQADQPGRLAVIHA